ncbi:MAG: TolC family outer membrane protein [Gammaproteobacteria bacterium]|nr:TolC family outer membrane protein [Gammaproteobacteria bacterium]MDP6731618.1 TolC family outer membrane protein [Gammaproteobacteria bacterium]|tara:strand:+ start:13 stop:1413 length:1401 start_codon:yes stop_codon:yes gene_type:complete
MGRIAKFIGILLVGSLSSTLSYGDDLITILQLALDNDPTLKQAQASYRANRENVIQSRSALLPGLRITGQTTRQTSGPTDSIYANTIDPLTGNIVSTRIEDDHSFRPGLNSHNWGVGINQSVFNLANWYNFQSAQAVDKADAVQLAAQEQDLIMRVATAYFDVLRALDLLDTNNQEEEAALRSLEQTQQREAVGLVAITDVYDSQAAYDLARNTTILQQDLLQSRYEALEAITGQPHPNVEVLREDFPIIEVDGSLNEWEREADANSLQVAAAEYNLDASRKNLRARKSDHLPTIDLQGIWAHVVTAPIEVGGLRYSSGATDRTQLALNLTIPLYSGGATRSRRRAAEYNVNVAQESLELTKRQLTQNIRNAYRRVNTDVLVIAQRQQSITSAQSRLDATELGAEVGTRNIVEVLLARENLYQALRLYADARYQYVVDSLLLKQVAGILTPQDIIDLNEWLQENTL